MENIILPESGSVVIIDEQSSEALPLIKALSKRGIPTTYYTGIEPDKFPRTPTQKIRLVFLDLKLYTATNEEKLGQDLVSKLQKIIAPDNGPYILIIWSKHEATYSRYVIDEVNKAEHKIVPACIIPFEKSECLEQISIADNKEEILENITKELESRFQDDELKIILDCVTNNIETNTELIFQAKSNAIDIIERNIKERLIQAGSFHLFVLWENIINQSSRKMIHEIASIVKMDKHWEGNMRSIFYQMGKARVNKSENNDVKILRESIKTFNYSFIDSVDKAITTIDFPQNIKLDNSFLLTTEKDGNSFSLKRNEKKYSISKNYKHTGWNENEDISKIYGALKSPEKDGCEQLHKEYTNINPVINTKLHIETSPTNELYPGNIYEINVSDFNKAKYLETYLKKISGTIDEYKFIELEVSPICDFAQEKWEKSRRVSGLLIPLKYYDNERKSGDNFYWVNPSFQLNDIIYKMVFNQRLFKSLDLNRAKEKQPSYRIKRELLLDIIAHLSSHINRPGIMFVE